MRHDDPLTAALDTIPGRPETATAVRAAKRLQADLLTGAPTPTSPTADLARSVADELLAGHQVHNLDERAWQAAHAGEGHNTAVVVARSVADDLTGRLRGIEQAGINAAIRHLHRQLAELAEDTRDAARAAGGIRTADQAIRAGKADQYAALMSCVRHHQQIRRAQVALYRLADPTTHRRIEGFLELADYADVFPRWHRWPDPGYDVDEETRAHLPINPPWPDTDPDRWVWLAANAEPWVPTLDQARHVEADARDQVRPAPGRNLHLPPVRVR